MHAPSIRAYRTDDAAALADIFYDSIHKVAIQHYTQAQVNEWAPLPRDYEFWQKRLDEKPPYVAEIDGGIVGFITLEDDGHIDWTYTHPDFQRRGIAGALYGYMEAQAIGKRILRLYVEASLLAKPFFTKKGFRIVQQNDTEKNGQILVNWSMEKSLAGLAS